MGFLVSKSDTGKKRNAAKKRICPPCSSMDTHLYSSVTFSGLPVGGKRTNNRFGNRIMRMMNNAGNENDMGVAPFTD